VLPSTVVRDALPRESVLTTPLMTWYSQMAFVSGPLMEEKASQAVLAGARTVMSGAVRSTPNWAQAPRKVEKVSYSLKSDSSFMGFCKGPFSSQ